jgi:hypothetical protein
MAPTVNTPSVKFTFMATILIGFTVMGICHCLKTASYWKCVLFSFLLGGSEVFVAVLSKVIGLIEK